MKNRLPEYPLTKLPQKTDRLLFLLHEELKSRKLFGMLAQAGFSDNNLQPHLDELILRNLGITPCSGEAFHRYSTILDKYAEEINEGRQSVTRQALKAYTELMHEREHMMASKE